jgi:hypothetical protein
VKKNNIFSQPRRPKTKPEMDYTVNFAWKGKPRTAEIVPAPDEKQSSICAFFKDDELISEFGPFLNIEMDEPAPPEASDEATDIKRIILQSASNLPVIERMKLRNLAPEELIQRLKMLENDYGKRFTGLNNHKMLANLWERIKVIKEELEKRK